MEDTRYGCRDWNSLGLAGSICLCMASNTVRVARTVLSRPKLPLAMLRIAQCVLCTFLAAILFFLGARHFLKWLLFPLGL